MIRAATITEHQDFACVGVAIRELVLPIVHQIIAGKFGCVMARTNGDVGAIFVHIIDAMRNSFALGSTRKVVVIDPNACTGGDTARTGKLTDQLFFLYPYSRPPNRVLDSRGAVHSPVQTERCGLDAHPWFWFYGASASLSHVQRVTA